MKFNKNNDLVFEESEDIFYDLIINSKYGAVFFENILDILINNFKQMNFKHLPQGSLNNTNIYKSIMNPNIENWSLMCLNIKVTYFDFMMISRHFLNQYMSILERAEYVVVDRKKRNVTYSLRILPLMDLLLPHYLEIKGRSWTIIKSKI